MATDQSLSQRPQVSGALSTTTDEATVTGKVLANGLRSSQQMRIRVDKHTTATKRTVNLYTAFVGPNDDGHVDAPISIVAARGGYDRIIVSGEVIDKINENRAGQPIVELCDSSLRYRGCAVMVVPRKPAA